MTNLNKRNKAKSISTFDFSTLYTKLTHKKLLTILHKLIDFCFNGGGHKYITISKFGSYWTKERSETKISFNKQQMKDAVTYLLSNCYFTVGMKLFCQLIGIPMGSDPAPFFANLFLYYYESNWVNEIKRHDLIRARKFGNVFRFIDDLNAINDGGEFESNFRNIYPEELQLNKENTSNFETSFLDLQIKIENGKFVVGLFDKRDDFNFSIVRMPYKHSNLPSSVFYSAIGAETLRIAEASNNKISFSSSVRPLVQRMQKQGSNKIKVKNVLKKFFNKHQVYFDDITNNIEDLFSLIF